MFVEWHRQKTVHKSQSPFDPGKKKQYIFSKEKNECNPSNYKECEVMNRLIAALGRYSVLMMNGNEHSRDVFMRFMDSEYKTLIDDYIHFKQHHQSQLEQINDELNDGSHGLSFDR